MFHALAVLLLSLTPSGADAPYRYEGPDAPWLLVIRDATLGNVTAYLMPPLECRVGPLPEFKIVMLSQAEMDKRYGDGVAGFTERLKDNSFVVHIARGLSLPFYYDVLAHEAAHLRGCVHPN